ncbi:MAG: hypothetical protein LBG27_06395 [Spirochaetaceae bacterium]|jgi:hypothetical protein|nr:hypothetical protein [Spirochaetaceae bacterium]
MRKERELAENVWYEARTAVNIEEPLFRLPWAKTLLHRMLREIRKHYPFEMRCLRLEGTRLTFYIKPEDGFKLPLIMQWLKQTFSARFNARTGRTEHVLGERYWSEILWGGPPEGAEEVDWAAVEKSAKTKIPAAIACTLSWGSPRSDGMTTDNRLSFEITPKPAPAPG